MAKRGNIFYTDKDFTDSEVQQQFGFPVILILHDNNSVIKKISAFDENGAKSIYDFSLAASKDFVTQSITTAISTLKDNTLEFPTFADFPQPGEVGNVYIDLAKDKIYIWDSASSTYISQSWNQTIITGIQTQITALQNSKLDKGSFVGTAQDLYDRFEGKIEAGYNSIPKVGNGASGKVLVSSVISEIYGKIGIGLGGEASEKLEVNGNIKAIGFKTSTGTATQALTANGSTFNLDTKLNKPTTTSNTTSYPFVVGEDGNGNSARLPAGDLGKNFFNSDLSNTTARNHTMNAGITVNTLGNPYSVAGLPNKNADIANFRKVRVQNTSGLDSVVDSKNLLTDGMTSMSDAEKDNWRLAQRKSNENYNTAAPQISVINPFLIKNTDDFPLSVVVTGSNLFINLANSIVTVKRVKDSNGNTVSDAEINITQYVRNSESNNLIMLIYYNFYNATTGYYELKIQNHYGLQNLTSPQFLVVENYDLTPMLPFTVINSSNQLVNNTTINNNAFEVNLVSNVYGGILFDKLYNSTNGNINCIFDLNLSIRIPRSDYIFGEIFLGLINNDSTNNISSTTFPKIGFRISNINAWSAKITDVNTNNVLHTFYWNNDLVYYSKLKIFIKDGTYTITNVITGQVSQGFYNDFNELRFLIYKTYSTSMNDGKVTVSVSNFKKL